MNMNRSSSATILFIFSVAILFLLISMIASRNLFTEEKRYSLDLVILVIGIFLFALNGHMMLTYRKYVMDQHRQEESNIRDYYRYNERFEPPVTDT